MNVFDSGHVLQQRKSCRYTTLWGILRNTYQKLSWGVMATSLRNMHMNSCPSCVLWDITWSKYWTSITELRLNYNSFYNVFLTLKMVKIHRIQRIQHNTFFSDVKCIRNIKYIRLCHWSISQAKYFMFRSVNIFSC